MKTILSLLFINNLSVSNVQVFSDYDYGYVLKYDQNIEELKLSYYIDNMNTSGFNEFKKMSHKKFYKN